MAGIESAADLASFFDADEHAETATYVRQGQASGVDVTVIYDAPGIVADGGTFGMIATSRQAFLAFDALLDGSPAKGDELRLVGAVFVIDKAVPDKSRRVWTLDLVDS